MKLFQKLLLAPAAIGLFAPLAASASEANLMDVSSYSQVDVTVTQDTFKPLSSKNPLLAGGEGLGQDLSNDFDADSFSSTTSASFAVNWAIGSVDGAPANDQEKVQNAYDWKLSTVTSFTGNDSLDVVLAAGNGADGTAADNNANTMSEMDLTSGNGSVFVDSISYTSAVGDYLTYAVGFGVDGSVLYNTACVYEGQTNVLSNCGFATAGLDMDFGTNAGLSIDLGSLTEGLSVAVGYEGQGGTSNGLLTDEGADAYGAQIAYIKDSFGVSLTASHMENTANGALSGGESDIRALNAFIIPNISNFPTISFGYEWRDDNSIANADQDEFTNYFVGFQFDELGNGTFGAAVGSKEATQEHLDAETMWEAYYAYNYADGITITPLVYYKEESTQGVDDETGIILKTSFEF